MSLVTTHVAIATNAIWLTVYFSGYYEHSANLSSGQSNIPQLEFFSCIINPTCFLPW